MGRGAVGKTGVLGLRERGGMVRAVVLNGAYHQFSSLFAKAIGVSITYRELCI